MNLQIQNGSPIYRKTYAGPYSDPLGDPAEGGNYIGRLADRDRGIVVGNALINESVDIILVAAGFASRGAFLAAAENGNVNVIGADRNQFGTHWFNYEQGWPDQQIFMTSVRRRFDTAVRNILNEVSRGNLIGENKTLGVEGGYIDFVSTPAAHHLMTGGTITRANDVVSQMANGTIVPASHTNPHTPTSFPGLPQ